MSDMTLPRATIWYDGSCPLCVAEINLIKRLDAKKCRLRFVDLSTDQPCPLDRADMLARFHAQENGGRILVGAAAFGIMWRQVTPFQPLGWLAEFPPTLWLLDIAYRQFLRLRPRLQSWMAKQ